MTTMMVSWNRKSKTSRSITYITYALKAFEYFELKNQNFKLKQVCSECASVLYSVLTINKRMAKKNKNKKVMEQIGQLLAKILNCEGLLVNKNGETV